MGSDITNRAEQISAYVNNTRIKSRHAVALARQLERSAPGDLTPDERTALQVVKDIAAEVSRVREARVKASPSALRDPRNAASLAISALSDGLRAVAATPAEVGPEGSEATEILAAVLPEGTGFTKLEALGVWDGIRAVLDRIDGGGLGPRIDALVSPALLRSLRITFERLGRATKISGAVVPSVPRAALTEANARFSFALATYARALSVAVKVDDDASLARFVSALSPIDEVRVARGESEEQDDDDEVEPTEVASPTPAAPIPPGLPGADPFIRS